MVWVKVQDRVGRVASGPAAKASRLLAGGAGALVVAAFAGCSSDDGPTYSEDVAPIIAENCTSCHRAGGIAPFALTDYASVERRAATIADVTEKRLMPPMPVDNSGSCNTYANARWLTDGELETLRAWADAGAPRGDSSREQPPPAPLPTLADPDALLDIGVEYLPSHGAEHDDYRCFVVPAPATELSFLTAYEVFPGEPRTVHHVIVYQPVNQGEVDAAHALDAAEEGAGYTCFGGPIAGAEPVALWAPGVGMTELPAGTGVPLAPNRELIVQIHYNLENGVLPDRTTVGLRFARERVIPAGYLSVENLEMRLAPGRERVESAATAHLDPPASFRVHGALPHMHTLGRTLRAEAQAAGESRCLVDVDRWDFHWQNAWWYTEPLDLEDVTALSIRCGFDTRSRSEVVTWGEGTSDEMCISYFYVTTQDEPAPEFSCSNPDNPLFGSCFDSLLEGCFEPDLGGSCSVTGATLAWSDGSRVVIDGEAPGLYGADDEEPCIGLALGEQPNQAVFARGEDTLLYTPSAEDVAITCPDGSSLTISPFHMTEFAVCRGLACQQ